MASVTASDASGAIGGTSGVLEYLQSVLPTSTLRQLYTDEEGAKTRRGPFVCRAVLQQLSSVSQQVVVRLSCTGGQFSRPGVQAWIRNGERGLQKVLGELKQWGVLEESPENTIKMTNEFHEGVKDCFRHLDVCPWKAVTNDLPDGVEPIKTDALERYTQRVWDAVLHFLVGSDSVAEPPQAVVNFLLDTNLMQLDPDDPRQDPNLKALVITEKGYDFMLQDQHRQVWLFLEQYLQMISDKGEKFIREALLLLICLSLARVGEAYRMGAVPKSARKMLKGWAHFGLVYLQEFPYPLSDNPKNTVTVFYPTRVATQMLGTTAEDKAKLTPASALWSLSSQALESALALPEPKESNHLAIIVQTNFQVCAYTTSELHLRMLSLFCDVPTIRRLPNIIFLRITRDSVKGAFNLGIQARQILRFLEKNAHPQLRVRNANAPAGQGLSPVPANVVDQIWLWDRERSRVRMTEVYEHKCEGPYAKQEFQAVLEFAKDHEAHVWSSEVTHEIYVDFQHAERVRAYATHWKAKIHASRQKAEMG